MSPKAKTWLRALALNIGALALATVVGAIVISQVVYVHEITAGAVPIAPLIKGFIVSIIVAAIAPATSFAIRFAVFTGIYVLDLVLSIINSAALITLVYSYFNGDAEAAKPWIYSGYLIPFITGISGYSILRRYRKNF